MFDENILIIQDEELLDRRNLLKNIHPLMKTWYNSLNIISIKEKYGLFPSFWQDLENWEHLKLLRKLYLTVSERSESGSNVDIEELEKKFADEISVVANSVSDANGNDETVQSADAEKLVAKKRRIRWGVAPTDASSSAAAVTAASSSNPQSMSGEGDVDVDVKKPKPSRWSTADVTVVPTLPMIIPFSQEVVQQTMVLKVQLEQIGHKLVTVAQDAARIGLDPSRSPSPPPRYDGSGKRSNTRDVRMREELMEQRGKLIEELIKINPQFQPPSDFVRTKPFKRLMIPFREFPTYNFIGLIIGPRGNTQKELELATGCKISIRGKGSSKEGSKGRAGKNPDDDEELHVHVTADDAAKVEEAAKLIATFLNPIDDDKNIHKQDQLRELALINGTLKEEEYCPVCGEKGHRQFECPHRSKTFKAAGVKCSICGDLSHPTRDCPLKKDEPTSAVVLDSEYDSFMAELGDGGGGGRSSMGGSSSLKSDNVKKASEGVEGGTGTGTVTMLGTVDLSGILSTPLSSSGYRPPYGTSNGSAPSTAALGPKRQQTIIVVTTVLTGYITPSTIYPSQATTAPPMVSYATTTNSLPATLPSMPLAGGIAAPWSVPLQTQSIPHPSYSYSGYDNNANMYYPPTGAGYFQPQQQSHMPWGGSNTMPSLPPVVNPPPPPAESIPMPPPPSATAMSQSPWMTTAEQQQQGQPGIPYNYVTGR